MFTIKSESDEGIYYLLPTKYEKEKKWWIKNNFVLNYDFYKTPEMAKKALSKRMKNCWFYDLYCDNVFSVVEINGREITEIEKLKGGI